MVEAGACLLSRQLGYGELVLISKSLVDGVKFASSLSRIIGAFIISGVNGMILSNNQTISGLARFRRGCVRGGPT